MVNGVLTIPLSGTSFDSRRAVDARPPRLSHFVAGAENALAAAALAPLLDGASSGFSPLVFYGPHGCGKSHLARGLADWWQQRHAGAVSCSSGAEFAERYVAAAAEGRLDAWRAAVRGCALLVIDDLDGLADQRGAQLELVRTLDALDDRGGEVVVTARTLPAHWPALAPALRSRLSGGLAVPLAFPARSARRAILERLADQRGVSLTPRALGALAIALEGDAASLIAALLELELTTPEGQSVNHEHVRAIVERRSAAGEPTLREIGALVARHFGLKVADLKSPVRRRPLVVGRGVAMYLARRMTSASLEQIGKFFGGRDHTTVLYGCRRIENLLRRDTAIRQAVAELKKRLARPAAT